MVAVFVSWFLTFIGIGKLFNQKLQPFSVLITGLVVSVAPNIPLFGGFLQNDLYASCGTAFVLSYLLPNFVDKGFDGDEIRYAVGMSMFLSILFSKTQLGMQIFGAVANLLQIVLSFVL